MFGVCVSFDVRELILGLKLILHVWFHVAEDFKINSRSRIDYELKQLRVSFVLDQKISKFTLNLIL